MTATGEGPVDNNAICEEFPSVTTDNRSTGRRVVWALLLINASALIVLIGLLYFDRDAPDRSSPILTRLRWWSQPWGEYVPLVMGKADSAASKGAALLGYLFAGLSLLLAMAAAFFSRGRERRVPLVFGMTLAIGWLLIGTTWDVIRLRGQSADLAQYAESVGKFAKQIDNSWPDQGGEISGFGAFLAYPYGEPRTLLMLGDARIPDTPLKVAAVERTPSQAIRFQLTGEAPDVWLEWRIAESVPTKFRGGLEQKHTPTAHLEIATNTYVVKYSIAGPERADGQHNSTE